MRVWLSEPLDPFGFMYTIAQLHISSTGNDAPENLIYAVYLLAPSLYGCNKKETWIRDTTGEIIKEEKKKKTKKQKNKKKAPEINEQV
jgi:uncharacterized protein (DUF2225 family)